MEEKIENYKSSTDNKENINIIKDFQKQWSEIGHVPFEEKDQDDIQKDLIDMEKGEVEFWENVGINPQYIYELAEEGWEEYI